ncbi:MAG TPA: hypothetical protein PKI01_08950 [Bacteroidales bacterium]|nr:hypothetical protein [Bacteroidales bacterium]
MKHCSLLLFLSVMMVIGSCKKDEPIETNKFGKISFQFAHKVNGLALVTDTLIYVNAAGNEYLVNEVQYFISDVILHNSDGSDFMINQDGGIHYVDTDIPSTFSWAVTTDIPVGNYSSVSFTFGISEAKNQSNMFPNPPERDMFWPEFLGGGYHYMKLNGKWLDTLSQVTPFNFHLGIGQIYAHDVINVDSITGFVQNYFTVTVPNSSFAINENQTTSMELIMNIESWFDTPHVWDFNYWGGSIMQNQQAMQTAKENGADVFTIGTIQ